MKGEYVNTRKIWLANVGKPQTRLPAGPLHQIHCQCLWKHRPAQMSGGLPRPSDGRKTPDAKHENLFLNST